jgi:hypothetical protein
MTGPRPAGCPWTLTDVDMLRKLLATGMKAPAIAQKMNRTVGAVQSRKSKLKQKLALSGIGGKVADQGAFRRVRPKLFQMSLVVLHGAAPLDPLPNRGLQARDRRNGGWSEAKRTGANLPGPPSTESDLSADHRKPVPTWATRLR